MAFNLKYYQQKLADLEARRSLLLRAGKYNQSMRLNDEIERIRKLIEDAKPKPVCTLFSLEEIRRLGIVPAVIEAHIAADYMAACCYTIEDILSRLGGNATTVVPELRDIIARLDNFCNYLYDKGDDPRALIEDDDILMEALHKKTMNYILQRLKSKKK